MMNERACTRSPDHANARAGRIDLIHTWQILKISSTSDDPGKRGRSVYSSAMIAPIAHRSTGELYLSEHGP
jgi:hypothetical protein